MRSALALKVAVAFLSLVLLLAPDMVSAGGPESTNGTGYYNAIHYYFTRRTVVDPSQPGPEVAFKGSYIDFQFYFGTSHCNGGYDGPIYRQYVGSYQPVAYFSAPRIFCTITYGSNSSGSFSGTLAWD